MIINHCKKYKIEPSLTVLTGGAGFGKMYHKFSTKHPMKFLYYSSLFRYCCDSISVKKDYIHYCDFLPEVKINMILKVHLLKLQMRLKDVKYININEFPVLDQEMLSWVDRRCRKATENMKIQFEGFQL